MLVKRSGLGNVCGGGRYLAKTKSLSQVSGCTASSSLESPPSNDAQHECVLGPPAARVQPAALDIKGIPGILNLTYPSRQGYLRDTNIESNGKG